MKLGKLLAAGKSVIGGRRQISYCISDRVSLPKFISPKNPFAPSTKVEQPPEAATVPVKNGNKSDGAKTQKLPVFSGPAPLERLGRQMESHFILAWLTSRAAKSSASDASGAVFGPGKSGA